jgi:hypothetical protein
MIATERPMKTVMTCLAGRKFVWSVRPAEGASPGFVDVGTGPSAPPVACASGTTLGDKEGACTAVASSGVGIGEADVEAMMAMMQSTRKARSGE